MAKGWASEDAVQDQIEDTVNDAVSRARQALDATGPSRQYCQECGAVIPDKRRELIPGVTLCVSCQELADQNEQNSGFNRRASKDSLLR